VIATTASLAEELAALGLPRGAVMMVHASLRAMGRVEGGAPSVVAALRQVLGPEGTVMVPTHTNHLSEPRHWRNPPAPADLWSSIRTTLDAFDPTRTPGWGMGSISEAVRLSPGARRSRHPHFSCAALGPRSAELVDEHPLDDGLGERSPLGRLYELDGLILLLGVGHGQNTSLHLAEHRTSWAGKQTRRTGGPIVEHGQRRWITFDELDVGGEDFPALGEAFAATGQEHGGRVAAATARWMRQRDAVDFATTWIATHRR
jgi:aminoglycoside 3-N-acetyltransferase